MWRSAGWTKFWSGRCKDEITFGHALFCIPMLWWPPDEQVLVTDEDRIISSLPWETRQIHFCLKKGQAVSSPFSEPLASAKMKKVTGPRNRNTKRRFTASSHVYACRLVYSIDQGVTLFHRSFPKWILWFPRKWGVQRFTNQQSSGVLAKWEQHSFYSFLCTCLVSDAPFRFLNLFH